MLNHATTTATGIRKQKRGKARLLSAVLSCVLLFTCLTPGIAYATGSEVAVGTWAELKAVDNNFSGTVRLTADIDAGNEAWAGLSGFAGTFDGQGHTISRLNITGVSETGTGLLATTASGAVIRNLTISNSKFTGVCYVGAVVGLATGTLTMENVRVQDDVTVTAAYQMGGMIGRVNGTAALTNCWSAAAIVPSAVNGAAINGRMGGLIGWVHSGAAANLTGCLYSGEMTFASGANYCGGMVGYVYGTGGHTGTVNVTSSVTAMTTSGSGSYEVGGLVGGTPEANVAYVNIGLYNSYSSYNSVVGSHVSSLVSGGENNYWTPVATVGGNSKTVAYPVQLMGFALASKTYNFNGKTLTLNKNIDLSGLGEWPMLGSDSTNFLGTFDGAGYTLSGITVRTVTGDAYSGEPTGFVRRLYGTGASVQNLTISNSTFTSDTCYVGSAVGDIFDGATVSNVHVTNTVTVSGNDQVGGVVGRITTASGGTVEQCWSEATVRLLSESTDSRTAGGIVGTVLRPNATIQNCLFTGTVDAQDGAAGGILGGTSYAAASGAVGYATIDSCVSAGTLSGKAKGGILGDFARVFQYQDAWDGSAYPRSYAISDCYAASADKAVGSLNIGFVDNWVSDTYLYNNVSKLYGGACNRLDSTAWVFRENDVPMLRAFYGGDLSYTAVGTWAELKAIGNNFSGTVRLTADIDAGNEAWAGLSGFAGTFDGQGHTISRLNITGVSETGTGLFATTVSGAVIRNLTISNSTFTGVCYVGAVVGNASGALTMANIRVKDNVTVTAASHLGGLVGRVGGIAALTNCWSAASVVPSAVGGTAIGGKMGGLIGWVHSDSVANITGCLYSGNMTFASGANYCGGMVGYVHGVSGHVGEVAVTSSVTAMTTSGSGSYEVGGLVGGTAEDSVSYVSIGLYNSYSSYNSVVGSHVSSLVSGGENNYWTPTTTVGGNGKTVTSPVQLMGFALASKEYDFSGKTLTLNKNMDLSDLGAWPMLGSGSCAFAGTFNGGSYTLSGLTVNNTGEEAGFVAELSGTVESLTITDSSFTCMGDLSGAVAAAVNSGTIRNVRVSDTVFVTAGNQAGGLAGAFLSYNNATVTNCLCQAHVTQTGTNDIPGGLVATVRGSGNQISHSLFSGTITGASSAGYAGGLTGWVATGAVVTLSDCVVTGTYTGAANYGGMIGANSGTYTITACYAGHAAKYVGNQNPGSATSSAYYPSAYQLRGGVCANLNSTYWTLADGQFPVLKTFASVQAARLAEMTHREAFADVPAPADSSLMEKADQRQNLGCYARKYQYTGGQSNPFISYLASLQAAGFVLYSGSADTTATAHNDVYSAVLVKGDRYLLVEYLNVSAGKLIYIGVAPVLSDRIWDGNSLFAGLPTVAGKDQTVVDYGNNNFVKTYANVTQSNFNTLCSSIVSSGFTEAANNGSGLYGEVLTKSYRENSGNRTVTVSYSTRRSEIYYSVGVGEAISPHLNSSVNWAADATVYDETVMVMPYLVGDGNSFVFRLKNGHFVINDGGVIADAENLISLLEHMTPNGKPVVEAWFVSHGHQDHCGVLVALSRDPLLRDRIRVDGIYYNETATTVYSIAPDAIGLSRSVAVCASMLRTSSGGVTPLYRSHIGERYYFCDISVDVFFTQEQMPMSAYFGNYNDSSTWIKVNVEGQTVLLGADGDRGQMSRIAGYGQTGFYTSGDMVFTMRSLLHHGYNEVAAFIDDTSTGTLLITCCPDTEIDGKHVGRAFDATYASNNKEACERAVNRADESVDFSTDRWFVFPYTVGDYQDTAPTDISAYRDTLDGDGNYTKMPQAPAGKVFAGWYWDIDLTVPVGEDDVTGYAFPRYADRNVLTVRYQQDMTPYANGSRKLRIVTTVDRMEYQEVGFTLYYNNASGAAVTNSKSSTKVYSELIGYAYQSGTETISYTPGGLNENNEQLFSTESIRFFAFKLQAGAATVAQNPEGIAVTPYWITADGTKVAGVTRSGIRFFSTIWDATGDEEEIELP